jgi:hypothetical protein
VQPVQPVQTVVVEGERAPSAASADGVVEGERAPSAASADSVVVEGERAPSAASADSVVEGERAPSAASAASEWAPSAASADSVLDPYTMHCPPCSDVPPPPWCTVVHSDPIHQYFVR